jgi:hypothetical protein
VTPQETHYLWNLLSQTWGDRFSQQFGATPNDAWKSALAGLGIQPAQHAYRALVKSCPEFPPTLPQFIQAASEYRRPESSVPQLDGPRRSREATTDELRAAASDPYSQFNRYREYEAWRVANTKKNQKPPHPVPGCPDWLYLQRLAWIEAAEHNAAVGKPQPWAA